MRALLDVLPAPEGSARITPEQTEAAQADLEALPASYELLVPVVAAMPKGLRPVSVSTFLLLPDPDLENDDETTVSPFEWLCAGGDPEPVLAVARGLLAD